MCQTITPASLEWPLLAFSPVNLWSLPAAWKRGPIEVSPLPVQVPKASEVQQVNPLIRRILSHR